MAAVDVADSGATAIGDVHVLIMEGRGLVLSAVEGSLSIEVKYGTNTKVIGGPSLAASVTPQIGLDTSFPYSAAVTGVEFRVLHKTGTGKKAKDNVIGSCTFPIERHEAGWSAKKWVRLSHTTIAKAGDLKARVTLVPPGASVQIAPSSTRTEAVSPSSGPADSGNGKKAGAPPPTTAAPGGKAASDTKAAKASGSAKAPAVPPKTAKDKKSNNKGGEEEEDDDDDNDDDKKVGKDSGLAPPRAGSGGGGGSVASSANKKGAPPTSSPAKYKVVVAVYDSTDVSADPHKVIVRFGGEMLATNFSDSGTWTSVFDFAAAKVEGLIRVELEDFEHKPLGKFEIDVSEYSPNEKRGPKRFKVLDGSGKKTGGKVKIGVKVVLADEFPSVSGGSAAASASAPAGASTAKKGEAKDSKKDKKGGKEFDFDAHQAELEEVGDPLGTLFQRGVLTIMEVQEVPEAEAAFNVTEYYILVKYGKQKVYSTRVKESGGTKGDSVVRVDLSGEEVNIVGDPAANPELIIEFYGYIPPSKSVKEEPYFFGQTRLSLTGIPLDKPFKKVISLKNKDGARDRSIQGALKVKVLLSGEGEAADDWELGLMVVGSSGGSKKDKNKRKRKGKKGKKAKSKKGDSSGEENEDEQGSESGSTRDDSNESLSDFMSRHRSSVVQGSEGKVSASNKQRARILAAFPEYVAVKREQRRQANKRRSRLRKLRGKYRGCELCTSRSPRDKRGLNQRAVWGFKNNTVSQWKCTRCGCTWVDRSRRHLATANDLARLDGPHPPSEYSVESGTSDGVGRSWSPSSDMLSQLSSGGDENDDDDDDDEEEEEEVNNKRTKKLDGEGGREEEEEDGNVRRRVKRGGNRSAQRGSGSESEGGVANNDANEDEEADGNVTRKKKKGRDSPKNKSKKGKSSGSDSASGEEKPSKKKSKAAGKKKGKKAAAANEDDDSD